MIKRLKIPIKETEENNNSYVLDADHAIVYPIDSKEELIDIQTKGENNAELDVL